MFQLCFTAEDASRYFTAGIGGNQAWAMVSRTSLATAASSGHQHHRDRTGAARGPHGGPVPVRRRGRRGAVAPAIPPAADHRPFGRGAASGGRRAGDAGRSLPVRELTDAANV